MYSSYEDYSIIPRLGGTGRVGLEQFFRQPRFLESTILYSSGPPPWNPHILPYEINFKLDMRISTENSVSVLII